MTWCFHGPSINLNQDSLRELSDGTPDDNRAWAQHLNRTPYTQDAWNELTSANRLWNWKLYRYAIDDWWRLAAKYRDTEVALAALENVAKAETSLGNKIAANHAWEMILLLPEVKHFDAGFFEENYRHNACVALADYYESILAYPYAERFMSQAIEHDYVRGTCGVFTSSVEHEMLGRLAAMRSKQENRITE